MAFSKKLALHYIRTKFTLLSAVSKKKAAAAAFELFCTPQRRNKKPLTPIFHDAEKIQFQFAGEAVHGFRWNAGRAKKLLILHGFESSIVNFAHFIDPLLKKDYEVLAFDAPAHGRSNGKTFNELLYKQLN